MGAVFLADDLQLKRQVALKLILSPEPADIVVARFEHERQVLAALEHPNIARIYDAGFDPKGLPFFTMEYIDGRPLSEFADKENLDVRARLVLFLNVCEGISHAHRRGVLHRDVKPANVLAYRQKAFIGAKVIDFGLAKIFGDAERIAQLTAVGQRMGTPAYMSPEQANGVAMLDVRTDVYSLGVMLFELLAGARPFEGKREDVLRHLRESDPPTMAERFTHTKDQADAIAAKRSTTSRGLLRDIDSDLRWIPMMALQRATGDRYSDVRALADDVQRWLSAEPVVAARGGWSYTTRKYIRRHKAAVAVGGAIGVIATGAAAVGLFGLARIGTTTAALHTAMRTSAERGALLEQARADISTLNAQLASQQQLLERAKSDVTNAVEERRKAFAFNDDLKRQQEALALSAMTPTSSGTPIADAAISPADDPRVLHVLAPTRGRTLWNPDALTAELAWPPPGHVPGTASDAMRVTALGAFVVEDRGVDPKPLGEALVRAYDASSPTTDAAWLRARRMIESYSTVTRADPAEAATLLMTLAREPLPALYRVEVARLARVLNNAGRYADALVGLSHFTDAETNDPALAVERAIAQLGGSTRASADNLLSPLDDLLPGDPGWRPMPDQLAFGSAASSPRTRLLASWRASSLNAADFAQALTDCERDHLIAAQRFDELHSVAITALAAANRREAIVQFARSIDPQLASSEARRLLIGGFEQMDAPVTAADKALLEAALRGPVIEGLRERSKAGSDPTTDARAAFVRRLLAIADDLRKGRVPFGARALIRAAPDFWTPDSAPAAERQAMGIVSGWVLTDARALTPETINRAFNELVAAARADAIKR